MDLRLVCGEKAKEMYEGNEEQDEECDEDEENFRENMGESKK